jgi:hypothetical protein
MASRKLVADVTPFLCLVFVFSLLAAGAAAGQSTKAKAPNAQKASKPTEPTFTCPDPLATEACKYFEELYAAHDNSVGREWDSTGLEYACFRQGSDQFFTVHLSGPGRLAGMRGFSQKGQLAQELTPIGLGRMSAFAHGVEDMSITPFLFFSGNWKGLQGWPLRNWTFEGTTDDMSKEVPPGPLVDGIALDPEQFNVSWHYRNSSGKEVEYHLVIQRSTGRFTETWTENPSEPLAVPFSANHGRCSPLPRPQSDAVPSQH